MAQNGLQVQFITMDGTNVYADFGGTPPGQVAMYAMGAIPYGWLECNGAAISRSTYAALFGRIGTTYGSGDGSTTFNIPDMRGYFARGWDDGAGRDPGRAIGTTQADAFKSHNHGINDPGHTHTLTLSATGGNSLALSQPPPHFSGDTAGAPGSPPTATTAGSYTGISTQSAGTTETRPINLALAFAIKT